jgi:hypothetical protein
MEYSTVLAAVEEQYRRDPNSLHYTVDRLSTDVQIKLYGVSSPNLESPLN